MAKRTKKSRRRSAGAGDPNGGLDLAAFYVAIGDAIATRGLTMSDAAAEARVDRNTISRMESMGRCPSADSFMKLLKWSGLDAKDFHYGD